MVSNIKSHTAAFHENLEQKLRKILFKPDLTPEEYLRLLHYFMECYSELEQSIQTIPQLSSLLAERTKLPSLRQDIEYMRQNLNTQLTTFHQIDDKKNIITEGQAWGILYVMEGSTLGGKHISNQLFNFSWIHLNKNINFFNSYGDKRGLMWKEFIKGVEEYIHKHPDQLDEVLDGARQTFQFLNQKFSEFYLPDESET